MCVCVCSVWDHFFVFVCSFKCVLQTAKQLTLSPAIIGWASRQCLCLEHVVVSCPVCYAFKCPLNIHTHTHTVDIAACVCICVCVCLLCLLVSPQHQSTDTLPPSARGPHNCVCVLSHTLQSWASDLPCNCSEQKWGRCVFVCLRTSLSVTSICV